MKQITVDKLDDLIASGEYVLDIRNKDERDGGKLIEGAKHIPMHLITSKLDELPKDKTIYVHCAMGGRSMQICGFLESEGYNAVNVSGGYNAYSALKKN